MQIKELKAKMGKVDIEVTVIKKEDIREFDKFGKKGRVCNAVVKDSNGDTIKLTLWNDEIDTVKEGDLVKIENGYVNEYKEELSLTAGKFGKLEVVSSGNSTEGAKTTPKVEQKSSKKPSKEDEEDSEELEDDELDVSEEEFD